LAFCDPVPQPVADALLLPTAVPAFSSWIVWSLMLLLMLPLWTTVTWIPLIVEPVGTLSPNPVALRLVELPFPATLYEAHVLSFAYIFPGPVQPAPVPFELVG